MPEVVGTLPLLFLTGSSGAGKSTLLLSLLCAHQSSLSGFYVQRHIAYGRLAAYALCAANEGSFQTDVSGESLPQNAFLTIEGDKRIVHPEVFDTYATELINQANNKTLVLLDEIGGIDLLCDTFFDALCSLLQSGTPCVGVYKSDAALSRMARDVPEVQKSAGRRDFLESLLGKCILTIPEQRIEAETALKELLADIFSEPGVNGHVGTL